MANGHHKTRGRSWPVLLLALPAFVAIWSGWVGLGELAGFGVVHPLPGIWDAARLNTAITLPIGVETYAAFALSVWLRGRAPVRARRFARWSAIGSLVLGALGQVAYHLLVAAGVTTAPWQITTLVAVLPVAVLGMGAALAHLMRADDEPIDEPVREPVDESPVRVAVSVPEPPEPARSVEPPSIAEILAAYERDDPVPVSPARSADRDERPALTAAPLDEPDPALLKDAFDVAFDEGEGLNRDTLATGLRARGHRIGTDRVRQLLARVKATTA